MAPKTNATAADATTAPTAGAPAETKAPRVAPVLTGISTAVPMPEGLGKRGRGGNTLYPFDSLEPGQSFGIKNKTAKNMASVVSGANKRFMVEKKDPNGNTVFKTNEVKLPDGTVNHVPTLEKEMIAGRTFIAGDVDPKTDPEGASVRVWRKQ